MANIVSVIFALSVVENRLSLGSKFECEKWRKALTDFQKIVKCGSKEGKPIKCAVIRRLYIVTRSLLNKISIHFSVIFLNK